MKMTAAALPLHLPDIITAPHQRPPFLRKFRNARLFLRDPQAAQHILQAEREFRLAAAQREDQRRTEIIGPYKE